MFGARFWLLALMIAVPAAMRVVDHPWNVAPVGAIALFAGAHFRDKVWAFIVPLTVMLLSDVGLGYVRQDWNYAFHTQMPLVYVCYALYVGLGIGVHWCWNSIRNRAAASLQAPSGDSAAPRRTLGFGERYLPVASATLTGAVLFFLVTNFGVWAFFTTYAKTWAGLMECYAAGMPYFRATLSSDVIYVIVLFGGYDFARGRLPVLDESGMMQTESL